MHKDLKILFWLLMFALMVLTIYTIVDYTFAALDKVSGTSYFRTVTSTYTDQPVVNEELDPGLPQDKSWRPRREPLPFLGYAHESVVYIITGILLIALLGFLMVYLIQLRAESHKK